MCNVILIKFNLTDEEEETRRFDVANRGLLSYYIYNILPTRGRDNYTFYIPDLDKLYTSTNLDKIYNEIFSLKIFSSILLHSRATPETEKNDVNIPNIYMNDRFCVAHHGIIPNAEKYLDDNSTIQIDSEILLKVYEDFDYNDYRRWYIRSLRKYPRASTEVVYDKKEKLYIVSTNFMPLYEYVDENRIIYSTYRTHESDRIVDPYTLFIV